MMHPVPSNVVPEAVRARLASQRSSGVPFDEAWPVALAEAALYSSGADLAQWIDVLEATRNEWAASYHRIGRTRLAELAA